jgi:hypothetical protein
MDITETNNSIHILGKLNGTFSIAPDASKIVYITHIKDDQYQTINVLVYDVLKRTTITVNNLETLYCWMYYGAHHWTFFQKIHNIWMVDIQFNPFLYPNTDDYKVPRTHVSTMIRLNLDNGDFERLPAPFPDKHLIHIPLNNYDDSPYQLKVINDGVCNKCAIYQNNMCLQEITHKNKINRYYMLDCGAFTESYGCNECKFTYLPVDIKEPEN